MTKILHVDDEQDVVVFVKTLLEREGFKVLSAYTGMQCLEELRKNDIDLVLLDVMMPDMSGWDVYKEIKKIKKNTKTAFLAAIEVSEERKKILLKEGISDYIIKPFDNDDLIKRIKRIVGEKVPID